MCSQYCSTFSLVYVHRSPGKISSCYALRLKLPALILSNPHLCNHASRRATLAPIKLPYTTCLLRYRSPFSHFFYKKVLVRLSLKLLVKTNNLKKCQKFSKTFKIFEKMGMLTFVTQGKKNARTRKK